MKDLRENFSLVFKSIRPDHQQYVEDMHTIQTIMHIFIAQKLFASLPTFINGEIYIYILLETGKTLPTTICFHELLQI